jgi:hypothetical protein
MDNLSFIGEKIVSVFMFGFIFIISLSPLVYQFGVYFI